MDNLCDRFFLVRVLASCPQGKVRVRGAEKDVVRAHNVKDVDKVAVIANVYNNANLRAIMACQSDLREWIFPNSVPWDRNAYRMMANEKRGELDKRYNDAVIEVARLEKVFLDDYEANLPTLKANLGTIADMVAFPSRSAFKGKIGLEISIQPVPVPGADPRTGWSEEQLESYREQVKRDHSRGISAALLDVAKRVSDVIGRVADRAEAYNGGRKGSFRDATFENCKELVDVMGTLNITNDPTIEAIRKDIENHICKYSPSELRKDVAKLNEVRVASRNILDRIGSFSGDRMSELGIEESEFEIDVKVQ